GFFFSGGGAAPRRPWCELRIGPRLRPLRPFARPGHDVFGELVLRQRVLVRVDARAPRDAGRVHALGVVRDQRVPPVEVAARRDQAVGAGGGEPVQLAEILRGEAHAVGNARGAVRVVAAAATGG